MSDLIAICKNGNAQLSDNFVESEFYSKSEDAPNCHTISSKLIQAVQLVRTVYGMPICITSTYRTALGNTLVGSSPTSRHRTPEAAVDFKACNEAQNDELIGQLYAEFREQGEVYQTLRSLGVNGFGFYDGFIHFDVRPDFAYWDETSGKFGDTDLDGKKKKLSSEVLFAIRWRGWIERLSERISDIDSKPNCVDNCRCGAKKKKVKNERN